MKMRSLLAVCAALSLAQPLLAGQAVTKIPATDVTFRAHGSGAVVRTAEAKFQDIVSVLDYGAVCDGATSTSHGTSQAFNAAIAALPHGGTVFVPATLLGCLVDKPINLTSGVQLIGESKGADLIVTSASVSAIVGTDVQSVVLQSLTIIYTGATASTSDGVQLTDSPNNMFVNVDISGFNNGINFVRGTSGNSSFGNTIVASRVYGNKVNILGANSTSTLTLINATFGGGAVTGIALTDSDNLTILGGDCEGVSLTCVDIDSSATNASVGAINIIGVHFEANSSTAGDIRIGKTNTVNGVRIVGNEFYGCGGRFYP